MNRRSLFLKTALILTLLLAAVSRRVPAQSASSTSPQRPKLIIMLVIDQFRYDYLERFRPYFVARGFNLLLSGANFVDCRYDYAITVTCAGHATLFTGAYANVHGIIGNDWFDPTSRRKVNCVEDAETSLVGATGKGASPRLLMATTIGDELRMASGFKSKVIAVSLKDRAAVIPGGHTANAAYWYDTGIAHFVTSTYYEPTLPDWVARFNEQEPAKAYCSPAAWQALPETPLEDKAANPGGKLLSQFQSQPGEPCLNPRFLNWLSDTPFMNKIELDFAREAVQNERLGQGPATDLLAISLSVNDSIGHAFGPYSDQVADVTLRTDRDLADFFSSIDRLVGLDDVWITLSADHGVAPNGRFSAEHRLTPNRFVPSQVETAVQATLLEAFGEANWVQYFSMPYISLDPLALAKYRVDRAKAEQVAAEAAAAAPGVWAAFARSQFLTGALPPTSLARQAANSFNSQRSGDVFLIIDPFLASGPNDIRTNHGTPWSYDAQVPLIFWGKAFKTGVYSQSVQPIDLVATLAAALGLTQPSGSEGRPLSFILK